MSNGQAEYDLLNQTAQAEAAPIIQEAGKFAVEDIQDRLIGYIDEALATSSDPRLAKLPSLGPILQVTGNVTTVLSAIDDSVAAANALNSVSCGDYETGKNGDFPTAVRQYTNTLDATAAMLKAGSSILAAVAILPGAWPAALPAMTLGLLASEIEAIKDLVAKLTSLCGQIADCKSAFETDLAFIEAQNAKVDGNQLNLAYQHLPTHQPTPGSPSQPPPAAPPSSPGNSSGKPVDPLILDRDGDGVELTPNGTPPVFFDREGDGSAALTTWVDPDDALLARDLDFNGLIETQAELFGSADVNALADLGAQDSNGDGVIDHNDAIWGTLRVWRDINQNGVTDSGELQTMEEAGIVSFSYAASGAGTVIADATMAGFGSYVTSTGEVRETGAANFIVNEFFAHSTLPPGVALDPAAIALPELHAMGQVADLQQAMTLDPALLATVQDLRDHGAEMSGQEFHAAFEAMLWQWTGVDPGSYATRAEFVSAFLHTVLRADPSSSTGLLPTQEEGTYEEIVDSLALRFVIETATLDAGEGAPFDAFTPFLNLLHDAPTGVITGWPEHIVKEIVAATPSDHAEALAWIEKTATLLSPLQWEFYNRDQGGWRGDLADWFGGIDDLGVAAFALEAASAFWNLAGTAGADAIALFHGRHMGRSDSDVSIVRGGTGDDAFTHTFEFLDTTAEVVSSFIYAQGDGDDTIDATGADHIVHRIFLTDINSADGVIRLADDGFSPIIEFANGGSITFTGVSSTTFAIEVYYADGVVADQFEIISVEGGIANDDLTGTSDNDNFDGGAGTDTLTGLEGDDTYHFFDGGDRDNIVEGPFGGNDTLWLHDRSVDELIITRVGDDAVITFNDASDERVTLVDQFGSFFFAQTYNNYVENIRFSDGSAISAAGLVELYFQQFQTVGDDTITGNGVAETIHLGDGEDIVHGGGGADIFVRDAGSTGDDTIDGSGANLVLEGLTAGDVTFEKSGGNLILHIAGGDVTLNGQFGTLGFDTVGAVTFGDGTSITSDRIAAMFSTVGTGGTPGGPGDDAMDGTGGNDVLDGAGGNDLLRGLAGADTYYWGRNTGSDTIDEQGTGPWVETDRLVITGVALDDLDFAKLQNDDLVITDTVTGETLTVQDHFFGLQLSIEEIRLDGGIVLTLADIAARAVLSGTAGDDSNLDGTDGGEQIAGLGGNDIIGGFAGDDTLAGGLGDDQLTGGVGSDTYLFQIGDGQDTIFDQYEEGGFGDSDTLRISGVTLSELSFHLRTETIGDDMFIEVGTGGDTILVKSMFAPFTFDTIQEGIWRIVLDDGTILDRDDMRALSKIAGTPGNDFIEGTPLDDIIECGAGQDSINADISAGNDTFIWGVGRDNDTILVRDTRENAGLHTLILDGLDPADVVLAKQPNDDLTVTITATGEVLTLTNQFFVTSTGIFSGVGEIHFADGTVITRDELAHTFALVGTSGQEFIGGTDGDDVIQGLGDDDTLDGSRGNDLFLYASGDGDDHISDSLFGQGGMDTLWLTDLLQTDVSFARGTDDISSLDITIIPTGEVIRVDFRFSYSGALETVRFADNSEISVDDLATLPVLGTPGDDTLTGDEFGTVFEGGAGNDTLNGKAGDDTYRFRPGDGDDTVDEEGEHDAGDAVVFEGYSLADATFSRDGVWSLRIDVGGTGDSVRIVDQLLEPLAGVELFVFDDGVLRMPDVAALLGELDHVGGNTPDTLIGNLANDRFEGGLDDDTIVTGGGADRIVFATGDGADTIQGFISGPHGTVIELVGMAIADFDALLALASEDASGVTIDLGGGDSLSLEGVHLADLDPVNFGYAPDPLLGDPDGGVITGTVNDDILLGADGIDRLFGRAGNDMMDGGKGNDVFELRDGDGSDTIVGGDDWDTVTYVGGSAVTVDLVAGTLNSFGLSASFDGIEGIVTGNGADVVAGDDLSNSIDLGGGADAASGAAGDDFLFGGTGNDRLRGGSGSDFMTGGNDRDHLKGGQNGDWLIGDAGSDKLIGAAGADTLYGGSGNDKLDGGMGPDELSGGLGNDAFVFQGVAEGGDTITDFSSADAKDNDHFEFRGSAFGGLAAGVLADENFQSSASDAALTGDVRFLFETDTGILRFDADGSGVGAAAIVAYLQTGATMTAGDIFIA